MRPYKVSFSSIPSFISLKEGIDIIGNSLKLKLSRGTKLDLSRNGLLGDRYNSRTDLDKLGQEGFEVLVCDTCGALLRRTYTESSSDD